MTELFTAGFWVRLVSIVIIDLTLAGDNALVIALAVRNLPARQQFYGRLWGTAGAVGLRLAFIFIATFLLRLAYLQVIGGLLLIWIAIKLVRQQGAEGGPDGHVRQGTTLLEAVWIIIVADAVMSLDNVLAVAAAAHGDMLLVIFGIGLSIPIVIWGSGLLARLMNRFAWIIWVGGGILGYFAMQMILHDKALAAWIGTEQPVWGRPVAFVAFLIVTALGWWFSRNAARAGHPVEEV
jgi:YjbE family integral membrane protein